MYNWQTLFALRVKSKVKYDLIFRQNRFHLSQTTKFDEDSVCRTVSSGSCAANLRSDKIISHKFIKKKYF